MGIIFLFEISLIMQIIAHNNLFILFWGLIRLLNLKKNKPISICGYHSPIIMQNQNNTARDIDLQAAVSNKRLQSGRINDLDAVEVVQLYAHLSSSGSAQDHWLLGSSLISQLEERANLR